mmetsp:Transcript_6505/g.14795  ORF Transcript_6505/g.14795 Transcript_6505/m.14795 type:complete len:140 (+) Transcript_6505:1332-1751(+)
MLAHTRIHFFLVSESAIPNKHRRNHNPNDHESNKDKECNLKGVGLVGLLLGMTRTLKIHMFRPTTHHEFTMPKEYKRGYEKLVLKIELQLWTTHFFLSHLPSYPVSHLHFPVKSPSAISQTPLVQNPLPMCPQICVEVC